ncbi:MAG: hypothetical protein HY901_25305 [Deltaproteobacteria bacterium]|nr:hypothetical protein [Deltaproteobacteria bacterium]
MRHAPAIVALAWLMSLAPAAQGQVVVIGEGPDLSAGWIVGRVCEDKDKDLVCSRVEPAVVRARVLLSDGTFAVTDAQGRFHVAAVPARRAETRSDHIREAYGRLTVKLDLDSIGRGASVRGGPRRIVEIGPAALQQADFPVTFSRPAATAIAPAPGTAPRGGIRQGLHHFLATGRTAPGHLVRVEGRAATVSPEGLFAVEVPVQVGRNSLAILDLAPGGDLVLYRQQVTVVKRDRGGALFVPEEPMRFASLTLPDTRAAPATRVSVTVQASPRTEVALGASRASVDIDGTARLEIELERGENTVPLRLVEPGFAPVEAPITIHARGLSFASALLSLEMGYAPSPKVFHLLGRGIATGQWALGELDLSAGLNLDAGDLLTAAGSAEDGLGNPLDADALVFLRPREPLAIERALDPELYPPVSGDDGVTEAMNPSGMRIWARLKHPRFGEARIGSFHAILGGVEIGRYERSLFGGMLDARAPLGPVMLRAQGFASPPFAATGEAVPVPAHDEFTGTGGSLFFLQNAAMVPGSEKLRVELRDGLTGLPLEERALVRYQDYEVDYLSGRILLARPLPMTTAEGPLLATPLQAYRPVLIVDYEHRSALGGRAETYGGRGGVSVGRWAELSASAVTEHRFDSPGFEDYRLYGARGRGRIGPVVLAAEVAQSEGALFAPSVTGGFGFSDTGGLAFVGAVPTSTADPRRAYSLRASVGEERLGAQLWARGREGGFSDASSAAQARARQVGGLARGTFGRWELVARFDDREGADPRQPFGDSTAAARDGLLRLQGRFGALSAAAEATYSSLEMQRGLAASEGDLESGGRVGLGLRLDYAIVAELSVNASHRQRILQHGDGPGALDDSFSAVGATYRPKDDLAISVRGGWGPGVGTQVQVGAERAAAGEVAYGLWTADVDGSSAGETVAVSGARQRVDENADVYVEDVFAREVDALRTGRAMGLSVAPARRLQLSARYERGVRLPFTATPALLRDSGSGRASWLVAGLRLSALAEVRHERGQALAGSAGHLDSSVDRWQTVGGAMVDARPFDWLGLGGRLLASKTRNFGQDETSTLEGYVSAALRLEPWVVLASYSIIHREPVPGQGGSFRQLEHLVALRPSVVLWDRVRIGSGLHAAFFRAEGVSNALAVSLRPAVRIVGGLEVAAEVARRSQAPQGESLDALRVEVAYWFEGLLGVALGYNLHGFSGTGVEDTERSDRIYLRLEAAY